MKRKLFLSSAVISAMLASGAMGQVVNFHDANNGQLSFPGVGYDELFAGQGAYSDPGNDIWNGFGNFAGYGSTYFYSGAPGGGGPWPQEYGNPGNPYAAYNSGSGWVTATGTNLFDFSTGSPTNTGNATSAGGLSPVTLSIGGYNGDNGIGGVGANAEQNGSPGFLLGEGAFKTGTNSAETIQEITLHNVPAGTYGLYLYGANYNNNRGTSFAVNSGSAHNGIAATLNSNTGTEMPALAFVEGQNFVIFENVTPDASNNITITASPNPQDGVGNNNLTNESDFNGLQLIHNPPPTAQGMTSAQNVLAGGAASFSFSPVFAANPSFQWQSVIGGVTNTLADGPNISGATTTTLTVANVSTGNVGLYQCVITTAAATNTSPAAPLTLLVSTATGPLQWGDATSVAGNVLQPGDALTDVNNNTAAPYNSIPPTFDDGVADVEDNTLFQYVNYGANGSVAPFSGPAGFVVTPNIGASIVTGLRFFASSSHPEDDPADYLLEGSNDGGTNYTPIAGGLLALPDQRNATGGAINVSNQVLQEIDFANTAVYTTYQLQFTNVKNDVTASNGVQIGEIQFIGALPASPPVIVQQPSATEQILAGTTFQTGVVVKEAGPFTYKWSFGTTAIANATNATLTIPNLQATNSGSYSCVITSPYGSTNASFNLTVVAASPYEVALQALNPLAYWPLDEDSGTNAYDTIGGYNATYNGGVTLDQPGVPFTGFGSSSVAPVFDGDSGYVDIPEGPFNIRGALTVVVWENISSHANFAGVFGHGDSGWRMSNNGSGQPGASDGSAGDATSSTSIIDGNWHMVVYSYTGVLGAANNGGLYVDGALVASDTVNSVPAGNNLDVWIGGSPDYGTARLVPGSIAHAAIFTNSLTSNQIQALFIASAPAPNVSTPGVVSIDLNGNGTIKSTAVGKPPLSYQWYQVVGGVTNLLTGATDSSLELTDVQPAQGTYDYFVQVSNVFGASDSAFTTISVVSGPPNLVADISPLVVEAPPGLPVTYSVTVTGTEPFTYQWSNGSGLIAGATNSDYTFDILAGTNTYSVAIGSSVGSVSSSTAVVVGLTNAPPIIGFDDSGPNWSLNEGSVTLPTIVSNVLTLTANLGSEAGSAFFDTPQYIGGFFASYVYTASGNKAADGVTFCVQDAPNSTNAVGGGGGDLGFTGITNSAAFELNLYTGANGGTGIQFGTDGSTPDSVNPTAEYSRSGTVNIASGDPIYVQLFYRENDLTVWLVDETTSATFVTNYVADLTAIVGAPSAYVGFTGGDGGADATQTVSDFLFSYTTPPILTVAGVAGSAVVTWPISVSTLFVLQQSGAINGPWENVAATPAVVNGQNQVTVPGTSTVFFRLSFK